MLLYALVSLNRLNLGNNLHVILLCLFVCTVAFCSVLIIEPWTFVLTAS